MQIKDYLTRLYRRYTFGLEELFKRVPEEKLDWTPCPTTMKLGQLLNHLVESMNFPTRFVKTPPPSEEEVRRMPRAEEGWMTPGEAIKKLRQVAEENLRVLEEIPEEKFDRQVDHPIFGRQRIGELLLFGFEHMSSHRHQLFHYLKQLGEEMGTLELYGFPRPEKQAGES